MEKNKRGISQVVATVLIIMLSVVAIATLANFLVPFVKNSLYGSTECMPYSEYYTFDESFGYNCYNTKSGEENTLYAFSIKRSSDKSLNETESFKIVFIAKDGSTVPLDVKNGMVSSKSAGGIWMTGSPQIPLRITGPGGTATYTYNDTGKERFESMEVYPVLKSGKICGNEKDSISLAICGGGKIIE
jgi:hypothetical protein